MAFAAAGGLFSAVTSANASVYFPGAPFLFGALLLLGSLLVAGATLRRTGAEAPTQPRG